MRNFLLSHLLIAILSVLVTRQYFIDGVKKENFSPSQVVTPKLYLRPSRIKESVGDQRKLATPSSPDVQVQVSGDPIFEIHQFKSKIVSALIDNPTLIPIGVRGRYLEMINSLEYDPQLMNKLCRVEFNRALADPEYRASIPGIFQTWIKNLNLPKEKIEITLLAMQNASTEEDRDLIRVLFLKQNPELEELLEEQTLDPDKLSYESPHGNPELVLNKVSE